MTNEEAQDLQIQVEQAGRMKQMVSHPAWTSYAQYLEQGKAAAMADWLKKAHTYEEFISSRQAYNTLLAIQTYPERIINAGDVAYEKLHPKKAES